VKVWFGWAGGAGQGDDMMRLQFCPDFNPMLVGWAGPDQRPVTDCSICDHPFKGGDVPLVLWSDDGWTARLCAACVYRWIRVQ
jgi:hypothetical protein